ncbi:MAG TPA: hypothetical protein VFX96_19065 [Pyrinomonadaceae bacterium]|nr:hypothetical protein [Pyrinomonadaceae bacterium]
MKHAAGRGDAHPAGEARARRRTDAPANGRRQPPPRPVLSVCVRGRDADGEEWAEVTRMLDASHSGGSFTLTRQPRLGQLLHITLPPPVLAQRASAEDYGGRWSLVWALSPQAGSGSDDATTHKVSVTYVGNDLPRHFVTRAGRDFGFVFEDDGGIRLHERLALVGGADAADRRQRGTRLSIPLEVTLEVLGEDGEVLDTEATVTENISRSGAAVWTALGVLPGARLRMTGALGQASLLAVVRQRRAGADGITRLHLEFVEGAWPLEGLR